jgi:hypothetical protein
MAETQKKSRLAQRLEDLRSKKGGFTKNELLCTAPKDGSRKTIRQVPYIHDPDGNPFFEVYFHYNLAGQRSILCPKHTFGNQCPICELAEQLRNTGTKEAFTMYQKVRAKLRAFSPVIERGNESAGVKLWGYGVQIYEKLMDKFEDPKWGRLSDPVKGRDIEIWTISKDSKENDTDFDQPQFDIFPTQSKLLEKKMDMEKIIKEMPNFLEDRESFPVKSYNELKEIVKKLSTDSVDEDSTSGDADLNFPPETDEKEEVSEDGEDTDIDDRLRKLLG